MDERRINHIWELLSWGCLAFAPVNLGFALYFWVSGVPILTGLFLSAALYVVWAQRDFIRVQLTRLACWYIHGQLMRITGKELTGFAYTIKNDDGSTEIISIEDGE